MIKSNRIFFKYFSQRIMFLLFFVLLKACAGTSTSRINRLPPWLEDKDNTYPSDRYLAEVGEGDNLRDAKAQAAAAIIQIFQTSIRVDTNINTRYTEMMGSHENSLTINSQIDFDQKIDQTSKATLFNLHYADSWQNESGQVYTLAYLERMETGTLYRQRITENGERVTALLNRALDQEEALRRYAFLDAALVLSEANQILLAQLEIINFVMARSLIMPYSLSDIRARQADQARAIKVRIDASGDAVDRTSSILTNWVTDQGFSVSQEGKIIFTSTLSLRPLELDNDYQNFHWEMDVAFIDSLGHPAITLPWKARVSGISVSAAESRIYSAMAKVINDEFTQKFHLYLATFLEK